MVLADRREFEARVLLTDERTDLAVLKIDVGDEELPALPLGDSDGLEVGDLVLAIGNPFGVGQTVTSGIVSALARTQVGVSDYQFFIQTDAAINPGNSGGALVNMAGELVGINTAIFSQLRRLHRHRLRHSRQHGEDRRRLRRERHAAIKRPGSARSCRTSRPTSPSSLGMARPEGALVVSLHPDSPLHAAGLKRGDIILAIEGKPVENAQELGYRVATTEIGASTIIEYQRGRRAARDPASPWWRPPRRSTATRR